MIRLGEKRRTIMKLSKGGRVADKSSSGWQKSVIIFRVLFDGVGRRTAEGCRSDAPIWMEDGSLGYT